MTASTLTDAEATFAADPGKACGTPTVTATLVDGRAHLAAGAFTWDVDLPAVIGGTNRHRARRRISWVRSPAVASRSCTTRSRRNSG